MKMKSLSLVRLLATPWTAAYQGSSVHAIFQARVLEWGAIAFSNNTLENPLNSKEIKPVNPKEINPEYALEGLMLKLKLQYSGYLMRRAHSLEKHQDPGKDCGQEKRATEEEMIG